MTDFILTTLKFLGLVVSGIAGYIAALPESKHKKSAHSEPKPWIYRKSKILLSKEWALRWVVIGLAVSLLSQFAETMKSSIESKEAQEKYAAQMRVATNSLAKLEEQLKISRSEVSQLNDQSRQMRTQLGFLNHMIGEFNTLTAKVSYVLISTNRAVKPIIERAAELAYPSNTFSGLEKLYVTNLAGTTFVTGIIGISLPDRSEEPKTRGDFLGTPAAVYSLNSGGYVNASVASTNYTDIMGALRKVFFSKSPDGEILLYKDLFAAEWMETNSSHSEIKLLTNFIRQPGLKMRIYSRNASPSQFAPDFIAPGNGNRVIERTLAYNPSLDGLIVTWIIEFPEAYWQQTIRMASVRDLDSALTLFQLENTPNFLHADITPVSLVLNFGNTTVRPGRFEFVSNEQVRIPTGQLRTNSIGEVTSVAGSKTNRVGVFQTILPPANYDPVAAELKRQR